MNASPTPVPSPNSESEFGEGEYASGPASLFHMAAASAVTCPWCFSEDVEVENEHGICRCNRCGETFNLPRVQRTAALDRSGPRLTGRPD